ncbi:hypothetical protein KCP70_00310 [Salmonella enterica subsp. enterica]|nr:hypothetical protein KCP70_00310 [Salmonella enterica subsp. enterica]
MVAIEAMGRKACTGQYTRRDDWFPRKEGDTGFHLQEPMTPETTSVTLHTKALASPDLKRYCLHGQRQVEEKFREKKVTQRFE